MQRPEQYSFNDVTVEVYDDVEVYTKRASPHAMSLAYAKTGRYQLYTEEHEPVLLVLYHGRLLAVIRKANNGLYVWNHVSNRNRNALLNIIIQRYVR